MSKLVSIKVNGELWDDTQIKSAIVLSKYSTRSGLLTAILNKFKKLIERKGAIKAVKELEKIMD